MKVELELSGEQVDKIIQDELLEVYKTQSYFPDDELRGFSAAALKLLEYYNTAEDFAKLTAKLRSHKTKEN